MVFRLNVTRAWHLASIGVIALATGCASTPGDVWPRGNYGFGHEVHVLFGFEGDAPDATVVRRAADSGIADDPRVQRFVDNLVALLVERGYVHHRYDRRPWEHIGDLSEVGYRNLRVSAAEVSVVDTRDGPRKLYLWRDPTGNVIAGAFPEELGTDKFRADSSLHVHFGQKGQHLGGYGIKLSVLGAEEGPLAVPALDKRNAELLKRGVMGIIVSRDAAQLPPRLVKNVVVRLSSAPGVEPDILDDIAAAAINATLQEGEIFQLYRNVSKGSFGDSNRRIDAYVEGIPAAVLIKRPEPHD
jgi:hypothetical protein